ncbi:hypothetical protein PIB30_085924 [Stylosanthes scabra]|uniref:Uncharacterized protein n=1 Tax=Stylosanthes scabra TaxID=79078 RepID=A0ABU6WRA9_9FABA|nr:hypothetical protein [Stylosanthes scabra]
MAKTNMFGVLIILMIGINICSAIPPSRLYRHWKPSYKDVLENPKLCHEKCKDAYDKMKAREFFMKCIDKCDELRECIDMCVGLYGGIKHLEENCYKRCK